MSCDYYRLNKSYMEVGKKALKNRDEPEKFMDDKELLNYLIAQERAAETGRTVSYESYSSD
ncbi:hypothetical protein ACFL2V_03655 [Pseudomonadota bacterium]